MESISFNLLHNNRKHFINLHKEEDNYIINGNNKVVLSAPHGVSQIRLGKYKYKEVGSLTTALHLQKMTNSFLIAKTKNNNDDANFDTKCEYRDNLQKLIEQNDIKYLIDFHGLAKSRECDVNLGIHLGKNIENNTKIYEDLLDLLKKYKFTVFIDSPFMGGSNTISGSFKNLFPNLWTIQIEVNCGISNERINFKKYSLLLKILENWIKNLPY